MNTYNGTKILILVAGKSNIPLIKAAKNLGFYVVTCDNNPLNPGHEFADENLFIDVSDFETIINLIEFKKIHFVFTFVSAHGLYSAAKISEHYNLPGYSPESIEILMNKDLFREFLKNNNIDYPHFTISQNFDTDKLENLHFPLIIKPVDGGGSVGVHKVASVEDIEYFFPLSKDASLSGRVIIEEFIDSKKLINGDCLIKDQKIIAAVIGDYFYDDSVNDVLPVATLFPTIHNSSRTLEQLTEIIVKLKIPDGIINFEAILIDDNSYIVEINPRPSGNHLWKILEYKYDIDIPNLLINLYTSQNNIPELKEDDQTYAYQLIYNDKQDVYRDYKVPQELKYSLKEIEIFKKPGDQIDSLSNLFHRIGILLLQFDDRITAERIIKNQNLYKLNLNNE